MSLRRSESELLANLRSRFASHSPFVEVGVGDDAAVLRTTGDRQIVSTDLLIEGVDFVPGTSPVFLAKKSMAANLSDVYACGAAPTAAFVALGLPDSATDGDVDEFFDALSAAAERSSCTIAGGDLSRAPVWTIAITIWGRPIGEPWLRSGARAGDELWYFGTPAGAAAAGLQLLLAGAEARGDGSFRVPEEWSFDENELSAAGEAIFRQLDPEPFHGAVGLAAAGGIKAAIDTSDGLLMDATRLADSSALALEIELSEVPSFALPPVVESRLTRDTTSDALSGGEDFALLVAAEPRAASGWPEEIRGLGSKIGRFRIGQGVTILRNGIPFEPRALGFDHFAPWVPGRRA